MKGNINFDFTKLNLNLTDESQIISLRSFKENVRKRT